MHLVGFYYKCITLFILVTCRLSFRSSLLHHLQCLLSLFFDYWNPEDEGKEFLRNIGDHTRDDITPLQLWRCTSAFRRMDRNPQGVLLPMDTTFWFTSLFSKPTSQRVLIISNRQWFFFMTFVLLSVVFVFVSKETKLKSQLHMITQPDGSNELHWKGSSGWRFGVISCLLCHDAFTFFERCLVQVWIF